ncbi:MAG TPA: hypothetical protein PKN48_09865 [Bacteroidales bacterium]|nr:hypothetical protein [Bacteroidales bacterium]
MKFRIFFLTLVFLSTYLTGIFITQAWAQINPIDTTQLVLRFSAKYTGSIGWGDVYKCKIDQIDNGNLEDSVIILFINGNDYSNIFMRETPVKGKKTAISEYYLSGRFRQIENDQPYVNFKNAFIDNKKRTWELLDLIPNR